MALLHHSQLLVANLGDCSLLVLRGGEIIFRTDEMQHAFNFPLQLGTHSRDEPMKDAKQYEVEVEKGDVVIVGSDGLMDNLVRPHRGVADISLKTRLSTACLLSHLPPTLPLHAPHLTRKRSLKRCARRLATSRKTLRRKRHSCSAPLPRVSTLSAAKKTVCLWSSVLWALGSRG